MRSDAGVCIQRTGRPLTQTVLTSLRGTAYGVRLGQCDLNGGQRLSSPREFSQIELIGEGKRWTVHVERVWTHRVVHMDVCGLIIGRFARGRLLPFGYELEIDELPFRSALSEPPVDEHRADTFDEG